MERVLGGVLDIVFVQREVMFCELDGVGVDLDPRYLREVWGERDGEKTRTTVGIDQMRWPFSVLGR